MVQIFTVKFCHPCDSFVTYENFRVKTRHILHKTDKYLPKIYHIWGFFGNNTYT